MWLGREISTLRIGGPLSQLGKEPASYLASRAVRLPPIPMAGYVKPVDEWFACPHRFEVTPYSVVRWSVRACRALLGEYKRLDDAHVSPKPYSWRGSPLKHEVKSKRLEAGIWGYVFVACLILMLFGGMLDIRLFFVGMFGIFLFMVILPIHGFRTRYDWILGLEILSDRQGAWPFIEGTLRGTEVTIELILCNEPGTHRKYSNPIKFRLTAGALVPRGEPTRIYANHNRRVQPAPLLAPLSEADRQCLDRLANAEPYSLELFENTVTYEDTDFWNPQRQPVNLAPVIEAMVDLVQERQGNLSRGGSDSGSETSYFQLTKGAVS